MAAKTKAADALAITCDQLGHELKVMIASRDAWQKRAMEADAQRRRDEERSMFNYEEMRSYCKRLHALLEACAAIQPYIHFSVANGGATPEDEIVLRRWMHTFETVRLGEPK